MNYIPNLGIHEKFFVGDAFDALQFVSKKYILEINWFRTFRGVWNTLHL